MRKEYMDRFYAPLVNPGITLGEYEAQKAAKVVKPKTREPLRETEIQNAEQAS